jgi:hypothetical protein
MGPLWLRQKNRQGAIFFGYLPLFSSGALCKLLSLVGSLQFTQLDNRFNRYKWYKRNDPASIVEEPTSPRIHPNDGLSSPVIAQ